MTVFMESMWLKSLALAVFLMALILVIKPA